MAKHNLNRQGVLFDPAPAPAAAEQPPRTGPRPWDPIDAADLELGWRYRWVTPARAREIREEGG